MSDPTTTKKRVANAKMRALKAAKKLPRAILVQKKVECDAKALKIVERMIEPQITEEWLLQNLAKINRSHLEDIIEERAITRLCGYVLCDNPLTKVVNKKYEISTLRNKVYDVQKTKNFCSFWCYSASEYLLEQMLTSPLWIRADEEIPVFMTFKKPRETMENHPGVEINIVGIELPVDVDPEEKSVKENEADSSNSNEKTETQVSNSTNNDDDKNVSLDDLKGQVPVDKLTKMEETKESNTKIENSGESNKTKHLDESCNKLDENVQKTDNNSQQMEKMEASRNTEKHEKRKQRSPVSFESLTARVEKSMEEWITKTTVDLIQGDDITKQSILNNVNIHEKYEVLCKKLNTIQLEEGKEERINAIQTTKLEPLPHFSVLKDETEVLEHKVKAFFKGDTTIEIPDPQERIINENDAEMASETFIPLTEAHAPVALRRRIFLDKLNKVLPDLLTTLSAPGYYHYTYTPDKIAKVKALVGTFNLTAANIVFKSAEWTLVALLLMKMLSLMDDNVKELLVTTQATTYTTMILMSYQLDCNYLDRLVTTLMQKTF